MTCYPYSLKGAILYRTCCPCQPLLVLRIAWLVTSAVAPVRVRFDFLRACLDTRARFLTSPDVPPGATFSSQSEQVMSLHPSSCRRFQGVLRNFACKGTPFICARDVPPSYMLFLIAVVSVSAEAAVMQGLIR